MKLSEMNFESKSDSKRKNKIQEDYEKLKNLSQEDLMSMLNNEMEKQKRNGTFDYDGIVAAIDSMKIYLPKQAYENIKKILENLK